MAERHAPTVEPDPRRPVLARDDAEGMAEDLAELEHCTIVPAELVPERHPGDALRPAGVDAVEALGEPGVDVEGHGVVREGGDRPLVERHGMAPEAREVVGGQADGPGPEHPLLFPLGEPEVEATDDVGIDLVGVTVAIGQGEADLRGSEAGQLVLDGADVGTLGSQTDAFDESGEAFVDLDLGRARAQGLGVEMGQDQPRLRAEREAEPRPFSGPGVPGAAGLDQARRAALLAFPCRHGRARIAVGQGDLAEDRVLVEDRGWIVGCDLDRRAQEALPDAAQGKGRGLRTGLVIGSRAAGRGLVSRGAPR